MNVTDLGTNFSQYASSPNVVFAVLLFLTLLGVMIDLLRAKRAWVVQWLPLLSVIALGVTQVCALVAGMQAKQVGWVSALGAPWPITIGLGLDPLGVTFVLVGVVITTVLFLVSRRAERSSSPLLLALSGHGFVWLSLTPWTSLLGLGQIALGGVLALAGGHSNRTPEEKAGQTSSASLVWVLVWSLFITGLGFSVLAGNGLTAYANIAEVASSSVVSTFGGILILVGLFIWLQVFPFHGAHLIGASFSLPFRTLALQVFPGMAVIATLVRLEPLLESLALLTVFSSVMAAALVITAMLALKENDWRREYSLWVSLLFGNAGVHWGLAGVEAGILAILSAVSLSLVGALLLESLQKPAPKSLSASGSARAAQGGVALTVLMATGLMGSVAAIGFLRLTHSDIGIVVGAALSLVMGLLGWKIFWGALRQKNFSPVGWPTWVAATFLWLPSIAPFWTEPVFSETAWLSWIFPVGETLVEGSFEGRSFAHWAVFLLAALLGYGLSGRAVNRWIRLTNWIPASFGVDHIARQVYFGFEWIGQGVVRGVDHIFWGRYLPRVLNLVVASTSRLAQPLDHFFRKWTEKLVHQTYLGISWVLERIQNGDGQFYLLFAIGCVALVLLNFFLLTHH